MPNGNRKLQISGCVGAISEIVVQLMHAAVTNRLTYESSRCGFDLKRGIRLSVVDYLVGPRYGDRCFQRYADLELWRLLSCQPTDMLFESLIGSIGNEVIENSAASSNGLHTGDT